MKLDLLTVSAIVSIVFLFVAHVVAIYLALKHASAIKQFLQGFPTHSATVLTSLVLIFYTGVIIIGRLALGKVFPDGYSEWLIFLGALAGIVTTGLGIKRFSSAEYQQAKQPNSVVNAGGVDRMSVQVNQPTEGQ